MKLKFLRFIREYNLFDKSNKILVAVSGGADSITLLHLLNDCGFICAVAHCNFQLRGEDAGSDAEFVKNISEKYSLPFYYREFDTTAYANRKKVSIEMAARELRYHWFEEIREKSGYNRVATAHHLNDSVETFFLNLFRGTGIEGLKGILPKRNHVVRPLLFATRLEILEYVKINKIEFRTDLTNFNTEIDRNWVRHELFPLIEKKYPSFLSTMGNNILYLRDTASLFDQKINSLLKRRVIKNDEEEKIPCSFVLHHPGGKTILHEWLHEKGFSTSQVDDIFSSLAQQSGKQFFSATHQLIKDRKYLVLEPVDLGDFSEYLVYEGTKEINAGGLEFDFHLSENKKIDFKKNDSVQFLDYEKLEFPLILRRWRKGDYFYPLGMNNKKKKVSDFFIDKKVNRAEKDRCFILQSGNYIAAIINYGIDGRFKISADGRKVYRITTLTKK